MEDGEYQNEAGEFPLPLSPLTDVDRTDSADTWNRAPSREELLRQRKTQHCDPEPLYPEPLRRQSSHVSEDGRFHFYSEEISKTEKGDPLLPIFNLIANIQLLDLPVLIGILTAMVFINVAPSTYKYYFASSRCTTNSPDSNHRLLAGEGCVVDRFSLSDCPVYGHDLTLHFISNDIVMVGHFALVMKEVTEALLPGGSLNPPTKALNPILTCVGGLVSPILCYLALVSLGLELGWFESEEYRGHDWNSLSRGWGIVAATDVVFAWFVARGVFGHGHPAIDFLLLIGVVDDLFVSIIVAFYYPEKSISEGNIQWLGLVGVGVICAFLLRKWHFRKQQVDHQDWQPYVILGGIPTWIGLIKSGVHPALTLNFIVPFMPGPNYEGLNRYDEEVEDRLEDEATHGHAAQLRNQSGSTPSSDDEARILFQHHEHGRGRALTIQAGLYAGLFGHGVDDSLKVQEYNEDGNATLHASTLDSFEQFWKVYVDFGMGFFALCNAGVQFRTVGAMTWIVLFSLIVGKFLGILFMYKVAKRCGFPSPLGVRTRHIRMIGLIAGMGFTLALFVADTAFSDDLLQGDARLGALLSGLIGVVAWAISRHFDFSHENVVTQAHEQVEEELKDYRLRHQSPRTKISLSEVPEELETSVSGIEL